MKNALDFQQRKDNKINMEVNNMTEVQYGEYKDNKIISIPLGYYDKDGIEKTWSFGVRKAKAIVKYLGEIEEFAQEG